MRGIVLAATLLAVCLLSPLGAGSHALQATSPAPGTPVVPQLFCTIAYETAGQQDCDVLGPLQGANEVRMTLSGTAGTVRVLIDDLSGSVVRQVFYKECVRSCVFTLASTTTPEAAMYVYSKGAAGHTVSVQIGADADSLR